MASSETLSLSIRHGVRVQPDPLVPVEEVLLAVGDQVGHANLSYASRMNREVVVFVKEERLVADLLASGVTLNGMYLQVSPLAVPSTRVTVSGVPPFIPNEALERELQRFGKMASGFKTVGLGCKSDKLRHVQSFRRQCFMFLNCPSQTVDVSFRVRHGEGLYMVYASTGNMKCFECGDVGHKWVACPHRPANEHARGDVMSVGEAAATAPAPAPAPAPTPTAAPTAIETDSGEGSSGQTQGQAGGQGQGAKTAAVFRCQSASSTRLLMVPSEEAKSVGSVRSGRAKPKEEVLAEASSFVTGHGGDQTDDFLVLAHCQLQFASTSPAPPAASTSSAPPAASTSSAPPAASTSPAPPAASTSPAPPAASTSPAPPPAASTSSGIQTGPWKTATVKALLARSKHLSPSQLAKKLTSPAKPSPAPQCPLPPPKALTGHLAQRQLFPSGTSEVDDEELVFAAEQCEAQLNTGELLGMEYLYSQTGNTLTPVLQSPEEEDRLVEAVSDEDVRDEGFEEETFNDITVPELHEDDLSRDLENRPSSLMTSPQASPPQAPPSPADLPSTSHDGGQHAVAGPSALPDTSQVTQVIQLWTALPEGDKERVNYQPPVWSHAGCGECQALLDWTSWGASTVAQHQPLGGGNVHTAVHFAQDHHQEGWRWTKILSDYHHIRDLVLNSPRVLAETMIQLFELNQRTLIQWFQRRQKSQEKSVLSQGMTATNPIPLAPDQLPPPKEKLGLLPSTSGPRHEFVLPPNLEGQAPVLRPGRRPAAATRVQSILPTSTAPDTAQPVQFIMLTAPGASTPSAGPAPPILPPAAPVSRFTERNRRRRALEEESGVQKRKYVRGMGYNTCSQCGHPKTKEFGHSRHGNKTFCSRASNGKTLEEWLAEQRPAK
ncbi:uncharacterized protein LOC142370003 [Odontesthes bonariensis]|uniref:uncharacterized protein LOC142370003 n=1 Tax=Odontesthes bonariensis TaxID=219752 RepID=UPI003F586910